MLVLSQAVVEAACHLSGKSIDPRKQIAAHALFVALKDREFRQQLLVQLRMVGFEASLEQTRKILA